jgi:hypothetical protein
VGNLYDTLNIGRPERTTAAKLMHFPLAMWNRIKKIATTTEQPINTVVVELIEMGLKARREKEKELEDE